MRLLLAAALFLQDSVIDDLRSDDVAVRDAASRRLRTLGREAAPRLQEALACETDPEARARLSDLLNSLLQVRSELTVRNPRLKVGERLDWSARVVNEKYVPIVLARTMRGSGRYVRYPLIDIELETPERTVQSGRDFQYEWTGRTEPVEIEQFVEVAPNGSFQPIEPDRENVCWFERWAADRPGRHRVRFVYDTSPRRWGAWAEHGPPELQGQLRERCGWAARTLQDPEPEVAARFALLHHERIVSPWVELNVDP